MELMAAKGYGQPFSKAIRLFYPSSPWKAVLLIYLLLNLKSLPFVWHYRLLKGFFKHVSFRRRSSLRSSPDDDEVGPEGLFRPLIISTHSPFLECDWNVHKSNSSYFSDLDVSRMHLLACLLKRGVAKARQAKPDNNTKTEDQGRLAIILGGVSCTFRREIKPYQPFEIWSRILCWDRKWIYIISHFVERKAVRPKEYVLQSGRRQGWFGFLPSQSSGRTVLKAEPVSEASNGLISLPMEPHGAAIYASALSRYVVKKGRLTIAPEQVFDRSGLLPPRPSPPQPPPSTAEQLSPSRASSPVPITAPTSPPAEPLTDEYQDPATIADDHNGVDHVTRIPSPSPNEGKHDWDWNRIEEERQRGMKLAAILAGMDATHAAFAPPSEAEGLIALGEFADFF